MLQFETQSVKLEKESCIMINIRELDRVPSIKLSTLHMLD